MPAANPSSPLLAQVASLSLILLGLIISSPKPAPAAIPSGYRGANFALVLDSATNSPVLLHSYEGGMLQGEVVENAVASSSSIQKQLGAVRCEPLRIEVDFPLDAPLSAWLTDSLGANAPSLGRRSGSVFELDLDGRKKLELRFQNAVLSEFRLEAADATAGKETGRAQLTLIPETSELREVAGDTRLAIQSRPKSTNWIQGNFRVEIPGLDTSRTTSFGPLQIRIGTASNHSGEERSQFLTPGKVSLESVTIGFSPANLPGWRTWFDSFVRQGRNSHTDEKTIRIVLLSADLRKEVGSITLTHAGIFSLQPEGRRESATERSERWKAGIYYEGISFATADAAATGSAPASSSATSNATPAPTTPPPAATTAAPASGGTGSTDTKPQPAVGTIRTRKPLFGAGATPTPAK